MADAETTEIATQKGRIRAAVRGRRAMGQDQAGPELTAQLVGLVTARAATRVSCFHPLAGEPDTEPFLAWALENGVTVLLPSALPNGQLEWRINVPAGHRPGAFGVAEPPGPALPDDALSEVDLMLIPACAVGRDGTRLGWGRGYFDRALASVAEACARAGRAVPPVFAVVADADLLDTVPTEPHDRPISGVVTPSNTLVFGA